MHNEMLNFLSNRKSLTELALVVFFFLILEVMLIQKVNEYSKLAPLCRINKLTEYFQAKVHAYPITIHMLPLQIYSSIIYRLLL